MTTHAVPRLLLVHRAGARRTDTAEAEAAASRVDRQGNGSLAILRYDDVRSAADPKATLHGFFQSAFEAGASLAGWDLLDTATRWCPVPKDRLRSLGIPQPPERGARP